MVNLTLGRGEGVLPSPCPHPPAFLFHSPDSSFLFLSQVLTRCSGQMFSHPHLFQEGSGPEGIRPLHSFSPFLPHGGCQAFLPQGPFWVPRTDGLKSKVCLGSQSPSAASRLQVNTHANRKQIFHQVLFQSESPRTLSSRCSPEWSPRRNPRASLLYSRHG